MKNKTSFRAWLEASNYSKNTIQSYMIYHRLLDHHEGRLTQERIDSFLGDHNHSVAKAFIRLYVEQYLRNPKILIPKTRGRRRERSGDKGLPYEKYKRLRDMVVDERLGLIMDLTFELNLRVSEVINLRPEQIVWDENKVTGLGKGLKEYVGYFSNETKASLSKYINSYVNPGKRIFPITRQRAWQLFKAYRKVWGEHLYPHLQKHTRNVHMRDVLKMSDSERQHYNRHALRETTVRVYGSSDVSQVPKKIRKGYNG